MKHDMEGAMTSATREAIAGRVRGPSLPISLLVKVDGETAGRLELPKKEPAGPDTAFEFPFEPPLSGNEHALEVICERTGLHLSGSPFYLPGLRGRIDRFDRYEAQGWAQDTSTPHETVALSIRIDEGHSETVLANLYRADLAQANIGDGSHAFSHRFVPPLPAGPHTVHVTREADGAGIARSPLTLEPDDSFDEQAQTEMRELLGDPTEDAEIQLRLDFLASELARFVQARSDRLSLRGERLAAFAARRRWLNPALSMPAPLSRRALVIDIRVPDPTRDAGSVALISHMRSLQRLGFEVVFIASDLSAQGIEALARHGIIGAHAPWFGSVEEILLAQADTFDVVYLHRWQTASCYTGLVRRTMPRARLVYSVADLHHVRLARQTALESRPELTAQAAHIRQRELLAALQADVVITHSAAEAAMLQQAAPRLRPFVVPWAIPATPGTAPFRSRSGFAFIGGLAFPPNLDAALFLLDEVVPLLQSSSPEITCHLIGGDVPESLQNTPPGVVAHGPVADLQSKLAEMRLTVAPLFFGAGIKGKVLDSLATGVPCVCSPIAAEGIPLGPTLRDLVASDAAGFARSIRRIHESHEVFEACRTEGLGYITSELSESTIDGKMQEAISMANNA